MRATGKARDAKEQVKERAREKARMRKDLVTTVQGYPSWSVVELGASWRAKAGRLLPGKRGRSAGPVVPRVFHSSNVEASPTILQKVQDVPPRQAYTVGLPEVWHR